MSFFVLLESGNRLVQENTGTSPTVYTALDKKAMLTAYRLINKYGKIVIHSRITTGEYDVATGEATSTSSTARIKGVVEDYNGYEYASGLVEVGTRKIISAALNNPEPLLNDLMTLDNDVYKVLAVETVWSGEQPALYISQVRK